MHPKDAAVTCVIQIQFMIRLDYDLFCFLLILFGFSKERKGKKQKGFVLEK